MAMREAASNSNLPGLPRASDGHGSSVLRELTARSEG
ncbi:hypothetical protein FB106_12121 [Synechococcus sp. Ace-Pa]|nr:hypothetical protein FB106_12121 [Synechococcus sp. Ace-Pa]